MSRRHPRRSVGWMGLQRGHRARPLEWLLEKLIFLVSLSAILMVLLIFVFIGREALPVALGHVDSMQREVIPVADMDKLSPQRLRQYLELTDKQYASMNREALKSLMELK